MKVLLIKSDFEASRAIELMLSAAECNVFSTGLGEEGVDLAKIYEYEIIVLDLDLPDISGFEVLRSVRMAKVRAPIVVVSKVADIASKERAFVLGADDYVTEPFHPTELLARVHAIVRRARGHALPLIVTGDLVVDINQKLVEIAGSELHLTGKEFQLLEALSLRQGKVLTKGMLLDHVYGGIDEPDLKIIDVFICKLRKKLAKAAEGRNYIETVWGRGYRLVEPAFCPPVVVRGPRRVAVSSIPEIKAAEMADAR